MSVTPTHTPQIPLYNVSCNPVFYWSEEEMEAYITENNLPDEKRYFDPTKIAEHRECGLHKPGFSK